MDKRAIAKKLLFDGKLFETKNYGELEVVNYKTARDVDVRFTATGFETSTTMRHILCGNVRDLLVKSVLGVGVFGVGKHKAKEEGKHTAAYRSWRGMLHRCYDESFKGKYETYQDCAVSEEWHNFQNFAEWYYANKKYDFCNYLDKDILIKGNKLYSPDTCCLVSHEINVLFTKNDICRGDYLIGVGLKKDKLINPFYAHVSRGGGKTEHLGYFSSEQEAFKSYKTAKEGYIKSVAEINRIFISEQCYNAMINYSVSIND